MHDVLAGDELIGWMDTRECCAANTPCAETQSGLPARFDCAQALANCFGEFEKKHSFITYEVNMNNSKTRTYTYTTHAC